MFLFIIYAVAVWFAAVKWRRDWRGLLTVLLGIGGILGVGYLHIRLNDWTGGTIYLPVLQSILYPYGGLVALVGFFIICLPRAVPHSDCRRCGYDLRGQEAAPITCPECGMAASPQLASAPPLVTPSLPNIDAAAAAKARRRARQEITGWRDRTKRY